MYPSFFFFGFRGVCVFWWCFVIIIIRSHQGYGRNARRFYPLVFVGGWPSQLGFIRLGGGSGRRGRLDGVGVNGGVLVLVHLIILLLEVLIVVLIVICQLRVLLNGLGEIDDLAAGATTDDIVEGDCLLGVLVLLVIIFGYLQQLLIRYIVPRVANVY